MPKIEAAPFLFLYFHFDNNLRLLQTMQAITYSDKLQLTQTEIPAHLPDEVCIRVTSSGICNTDIEITKGYIPGFNGILGHEFFGCIDSVYNDKYRHFIGKRVTAEINCGCGNCEYCLARLSRHCPNRTVLGIINRDGCFAEYISVPVANVVQIPDSISDNNALFIEPLAAALEIQEQLPITPEQKIIVIGDGKLAHLIAITLKPVGCDLVVTGKHEWKVNLLRKQGITAVTDRASITTKKFDIVIEASGSPQAFYEGLSYVKPRGTYFLKSTYAKEFSLNPAEIVVNEITVIGSRCGSFSDAIAFLQKEQPDLSYLISKRFPLSEGIKAFEAAQEPDVMKVVLDC